MRKKWMYIAPLAVVGMVLFIFIGGTVVKMLWNWLTPDLFGFHQINFWQAVGLLGLCRILFGGLGMHGGRYGSRRRMTERWEGMTPDERERFRQTMQGRCGFEPSASEREAH